MKEPLTRQEEKAMRLPIKHLLLVSTLCCMSQLARARCEHAAPLQNAAKALRQTAALFYGELQRANEGQPLLAKTSELIRKARNLAERNRVIPNCAHFIAEARGIE